MMRNIISLVLIAFFIGACGNDNKSGMEVGQFTTIEVNEVYDMGEVAKGEMIHANIKIKNTGDYPLYIANIEPACSCTISEYEEDPIPPGKTTIVKATVDTDKTGSGVINKPITITANTRPSGTTVTIRANVID